jgi:predicted nuclease of predicted toxin-antitoxin system
VNIDAAGVPLRVWVDAQLPPALAVWLRLEFALDAVHVQDRGLLHARDEEIFDRARQDATDATGLILITKDDDFVRLIERLGPPPQVLWVTAGNTDND